VVFNHEVRIISELVYCTEENKTMIIEKLVGIEASGSTNISDALMVGLGLLNVRDSDTINWISSVILITDGLSNAGISSEETLNRLGMMNIPSGCIFNTFGFGEDHDSKLLHSIALKTQGVYYYVPSKDYCKKIFGGCIHAILTSRARFVKIKLEAHDGSRIITLATPFQITQNKVAKEYEVDLGVLYSGEKKIYLI